MSLKDMFQNVVKGAGEYLENSKLKEKMLEVKDKTVEKVKGIDNPERYTAPIGFTLFTVPVTTVVDVGPLEKFSLKEKDKVIEAYSRLLTLLDGEEIVSAITASNKRTYLIVWTNKDRLYIVHKEHYKVLTREEVNVLKIEETGTFGLTFRLNEYLFTGIEKAKVYLFIRSYLHELTVEPSFISYMPITKNFNYYERFKYETLYSENQAVEENKKLVTLLEPQEYPLVSIFVTLFDQKYILGLTTNYKLYMISNKTYSVFELSNISKIKLMNKGMFHSEFYMNNYYFTGCGLEDNVLKLIHYIQDRNVYESVRSEFLESHKVFMSFPFINATSYQTSSEIGIVISEKEDCFLICDGPNKMNMYSKETFDYYELILEDKIQKEDIWTPKMRKIEEVKVSKEEAIVNYDRVKLRLFLKNCSKPVLEVPIVLMSKAVYKEIVETMNVSEEMTKQLLDHLDRLG